jgi:CheY-like chemotaxis protein
MAVILVMDDHPGIRDMLEETLVGAGHEMFAATNGQEGLHLCKAHPPDLMIIDMFMPEKDGLETIQELRRKQPDAKVIAISGAPLASNVLDIAQKLGAQQVLHKPFHPNEIISAVNNTLQAR